MMHTMKRTIAFLLTAAALMTSTAMPVTAEEAENGLTAGTGDIDGSGMTDILDVIRLNKHLLGVSHLTDLERSCADVNGDGVVDAGDCLSLLKKVLDIPETSDTSEPATAPQIESTEPMDPGYSDNKPEMISEHFYGAEIKRGTASDGMRSSIDVLTNEVNSLIGLYGHAFYENNHLIIVELTESSGSTRLSVDGVKVDEDGVYTVMVTRTTPQIATCDLARWYLYVATDKGITDPSKVKVEFTDVTEEPVQ